jgi:glycine/D-amino acid oxidase-like deaminating enzyme
VNAPDVIVVGAGIVGAAVASLAAAEGLQVLVVSDRTPGDGATAAGMGHLVVLDDDPAELQLSRYSLGLWRALRDLAGAEYSPTGTLWIATNDAEVALLQAKQARLQAGGVAAHWLDARDLRRCEPSLRPDLPAAVRVPSDAVVYAPRVAHALITEACRLQRARLLVGPQVQRVSSHAVVLDDGQTLNAAMVVVAAGIETRRLLPALPFIGRKGHLAITDRVPLPLSHQVVEIGYGASAHGSGDSVAFNVQPRPTGQVLIGSCRQPGCEDAAIDNAMLGRMLQRACHFMPALVDAPVIRCWTGVRPGTPDGRPYVGRWPLLDDVWVAAGHEGLGITTALGSARIVLDQMLGRVLHTDASPFDPARVLCEQVAA